MPETHLSQDAYERLKAELDDLTTRGRTEIARLIERAREMGDLSENGDYHAAKDDQGKMEARIRQLQHLLDRAVIVDRADLNWFTCFGALGRHFRVVAFEQRGHGRGIRVGVTFRMSDAADDTVAVADALGIDRFIVVGYSMGGPVAQLTWHRHRDRVAGLVLCATSRDFGGSPRERMAFAVLPGLSAALRVAPYRVRRNVMGGVISGRLGDGPLARWAATELGRNDPAAMMAAAAALGRFSSRAWISEVDVPAAVVITLR